MNFGIVIGLFIGSVLASTHQMEVPLQGNEDNNKRKHISDPHEEESRVVRTSWGSVDKGQQHGYENIPRSKRKQDANQIDTIQRTLPDQSSIQLTDAFYNFLKAVKQTSTKTIQELELLFGEYLKDARQLQGNFDPKKLWEND